MTLCAQGAAGSLVNHQSFEIGSGAWFARTGPLELWLVDRVNGVA